MGGNKFMSQNIVNRGIDNTTGKETVIKATNNALDVVLRGNHGTILSTIKDDEDKEILRIVDAAPFAYDTETERLKTEDAGLIIESASLGWTGTTVDSLGNKVVELNGETGYILEPLFIHCRINKPNSAGSGNHVWYIYTDKLPETDSIQTISAHTANNTIQGGVPNEMTSYIPSDRSAFLLAIQSLHINPDGKLIIKYYNGTDVAQTNASAVRILYRKRKI